MAAQREQLTNDDRDERGGVGWRIAFVVALLVFLCAAGALVVMLYSYFHADHQYTEVAQEAFTPPAQAEEDPEGVVLADMTVNWDYLRSINPDVVAWVYMPGTRINYPVVQGPDNKKYLDENFSGEDGLFGRGGSIFLDAANSPLLTDANSVMYGHHMRDGSMFACLSTDLANQESFEVARTVYVLSPLRNVRATTFALVLTTGDDALVETTFASPEARAAYVRDKQLRSEVYPPEGFPNPASVEQLVTLSTCDYQQDNGRAVLFAQVVDVADLAAGQQGEAVPQEDVDQVGYDKNGEIETQIEP